MQPTLFIVNPEAGNFTRKVKKLLDGFAHSHPKDVEIVETNHPGQATEIARRTDKDRVVAVGGDGTVNEVINGLIGGQKSFGVIPAGSGNDFIKAIGLENSVDVALRSLLTGSTITIDIGRANLAFGDGSSRHIYFANGLGSGFDASVAITASKIKYLRGTLRYVVAVMRTLGTYRAPEFSVITDSRARRGKYLLIAIGNGPCAGGGFYLTPDAKPNDGLLNVCTIGDLPVPRILLVMPKVMRGKHRGEKAVHFDVGKNISISSNEPFCVHADGQILGRDVLSVGVSVMKNALEVAANNK